MIKKIETEGGFTFVELLIAMLVLIAVGAVTVPILSSALRGSNKANVINNLKQSGAYAISQMGRSIRYAKSFDGVSTDGDYVYGTTGLVTNCSAADSGGPTPTPVPYKAIQITSFNGVHTIFRCTSRDLACSSTISPGLLEYEIAPGQGVGNSNALLDCNTTSLDSCSFSCTQKSASDFPVIGINFSISQTSSGAFAENKFSIPFSTSITIRNTKK